MLSRFLQRQAPLLRGHLQRGSNQTTGKIVNGANSNSYSASASTSSATSTMKRLFASAAARAHSGQVIGNPRGLSTFGVGSRGGNSCDYSLHLVGGCFCMWFAMGGVSGVALGNAAVDVTLHDTYYVVGHFHIIMVSTIALSIGLANACMFGPCMTVSAARALPSASKRLTGNLFPKQYGLFTPKI